MSAPSHPGAIEVNGSLYLRDAKGSLVPLSAVKPADLLMDETVRSILADARAMSKLIADFKIRTFESIGELQALFLQNYGATVGGAKGNITLTTFDGREKVQVQIADRIEFGPELLSAKALIDECLTEWAADGSAQIRALVNRVFQVDKEGQINRAEMFMLLRVNIDDSRWIRAMEAIRDSIRTIGSSRYVRFYDRPAGDAPWSAVTIDLASA